MQEKASWIRRFSIAAALVIAALIPIHCGSDEDSGVNSTIGHGCFEDSPVSGLAYSSGDQEGFTESDGGFAYQTGHRIEFSVGDIVLGEGNPGSHMTPVSLVDGAIDETHPAVANIARFLQTLDDDADPENGIENTQAVREQASGLSLDFAQSSDDFGTSAFVQEVIRALTSWTNAGERELVNASAAQTHLRATLLARFVGNYSGVYSGDDAGTWAVSIDSAGTITGSGTGSDGAFGIVGNISSSGSAYFVAGEVTTGAVFEGTVTEAGTVSGIWVNEYWGMTGTFSGKEQ